MNHISNKITARGMIFIIQDNIIEKLNYINTIYYKSYMGTINQDEYLYTISDKYGKRFKDISSRRFRGQIFYFKNHKAIKIKTVSINNINKFRPSLCTLSKNNSGEIIREIKKTLS